VQPFRRPTDVSLLKDDLKQHQQVEINPGKVNLVQHNAEIISLDSGSLKWDLDGIAGLVAGPHANGKIPKCSN